MVRRPARRPLSFDETIDRIRREFTALPGLRLTEVQVRRVWGLSDLECARVLERLTTSRFLLRTDDGVYRRADVAGAPRVPSSTPRVMLASAR